MDIFTIFSQKKRLELYKKYNICKNSIPMYKIHPIIYKFHEFNGDVPLLTALLGRDEEHILVRFRKDKPARLISIMISD